MTNGPPSPCPSDQPFNSTSSSLSESSSSHRSQEDDISIVTGNMKQIIHPRRNFCNNITHSQSLTNMPDKNYVTLCSQFCSLIRKYCVKKIKRTCRGNNEFGKIGFLCDVCLV